MSNRNYYKQGQSSKVPYILILVILALLYIMNGMNEDRKDADRMFEQAMKELGSPSCDSLAKIHGKEVDSLTAVIDWYKSQERKPAAKTRNKENKQAEKPAATKPAAEHDTL